MFLVLELITGGQVMKWEDKVFRYRCDRNISGVMEADDVRRCMRDVVDALGYREHRCPSCADQFVKSHVLRVLL